MRRLPLLLVLLLLAACGADTLRVLPSDEWEPPSADQQLTGTHFHEVSRAIGSEARKECLRQKKSRNCDYRILVDVNPRAPANAFQTLDDQGRPVIIFTQAMIESAQNSDELAFVMGHEAAHHALGHISRQAQSAKESALVFGNLARLAGADGPGIEQAQKLGAEVGVQVIVKEFELEADQLGTIITHNAGYNPLIGAKFFDRIPDPGDRFLGTHPPNAQRVEIVLQTAKQLGLTQ